MQTYSGELGHGTEAPISGKEKCKRSIVFRKFKQTAHMGACLAFCPVFGQHGRKSATKLLSSNHHACRDSDHSHYSLVGDYPSNMHSIVSRSRVGLSL